MDAGTDLILLYDGLCGFCSGAVRFILERDRRGTMRFAPLQGETAREVVSRHPDLAGTDSVILVEVGQGRAERVLVRSEAALRVAEYLGGPWRAARLLGLVPRGLRDAAYDLFARLRHALFHRPIAYPAPDPAARARFLP